MNIYKILAEEGPALPVKQKILKKNFEKKNFKEKKF